MTQEEINTEMKTLFKEFVSKDSNEELLKIKNKILQTLLLCDWKKDQTELVEKSTNEIIAGLDIYIKAKETNQKYSDAWAVPTLVQQLIAISFLTK
jgi:hypothetical protein